MSLIEIRNLTFAYPGRLRETVRSIPLAGAQTCAAFLERKEPYDPNHPL